MSKAITFINGAAYMALILVSLYAWDLKRSMSKAVNQQVAMIQDEDYLTALTKGRK
jgi:hypothetical protein